MLINNRTKSAHHPETKEMGRVGWRGELKEKVMA